MGAQKRLGRGLDALLGNRDGARAATPDNSATIPVGELTPGRFQPRRRIDDDALAELVQSIQSQGVLQPVLVRPVDETADGDGTASHEIVAGERRWRAAKLAGLSSVPVVVRTLSDEEALAVALVENLQREDLSAIEIAHSLKRLTSDFGMTHQQAADAVGRSRSAVSNYLRLLELESSARDLLDSGELEMGHARALLSLDDEAQARVAKTVAARRLSVREAEALVAGERDGGGAQAAKSPKTVDLQTRWLQKQFADELGVKVVIRGRATGKSLTIDFTDLPELAASLKKIESLVSNVVETAGPRVAGEPDSG